MSESGLIKLSSFNADLVTGHFMVRPDQPEVNIAMRFVFRMMQDEVRAKSRAGIAQEAAELAIDHIAFRYDLYKAYIEDFARDRTLNLRALVTAVICGEYITYANEQLLQTPEEEMDLPSKFRSDGFDDEVLAEAQFIHSEAGILESLGVPDKNFMPQGESLFLAHIFVLASLYELEETFFEYDIEDLMAFRDKDFPPIRDFLCTQNEIGREAERYLDHMIDRINALVTPPPVSNWPQLRLVPR